MLNSRSKLCLYHSVAVAVDIILAVCNRRAHLSMMYSDGGGAMRRVGGRSDLLTPESQMNPIFGAKGIEVVVYLQDYISCCCTLVL